MKLPRQKNKDIRRLQRKRKKERRVKVNKCMKKFMPSFFPPFYRFGSSISFFSSSFFSFLALGFYLRCLNPSLTYLLILAAGWFRAPLRHVLCAVVRALQAAGPHLGGARCQVQQGGQFMDRLYHCIFNTIKTLGKNLNNCISKTRPQ